MFKPYFDPQFLGGAWVCGICSKCGKKIDGYHIWHWRGYKDNKDYCGYCYPADSYRVIY